MEQIEDDINPAQQIAEVIQRIWSDGLTTATGGNITVRDKNGLIWSTPASVDKASLTADDIVCVSRKSKSGHKPTSELPFHQAIYSKRKDINAVIHAHPAGLTAFSMLKTAPETDIISEIKRICGKPAVALYQISGSNELAESISEEFRKGHNCVIMENHAAVVGGSSLPEALLRLETFELCAGIIANASKIGNINKLTLDQLTASENKVVIDSFPQQEYSSVEAKLRESICSYTRRCYNQGLMTGSMGAVSSRLGKNSILVTPSRGDKRDIKPEDIVKIKDGKAESGKNPDPSIKLHLSIYRKHPDIKSVMLSKPTYTMAFGITGNRLDTRTTPESFVLVGDVPLIPFLTAEAKISRVTNGLSSGTHCMIVENDDVVVTGQSLLQTYERLEVIESTAKSLIQSKNLGIASPISEKDLMNLKLKFLMV
ncbi:MAG: class II aldolase/adducin family protein [Balneolaceae bacterium]